MHAALQSFDVCLFVPNVIAKHLKHLFRERQVIPLHSLLPQTMHALVRSLMHLITKDLFSLALRYWSRASSASICILLWERQFVHMLQLSLSMSRLFRSDCLKHDFPSKIGLTPLEWNKDVIEVLAFSNSSGESL